MKNVVLNIVVCILLSVFPLAAKSYSLTYSDSIEISLLTCSPGHEVWTQYGHTAIRYNDRANQTTLLLIMVCFHLLSLTLFLVSYWGLTDYHVGISATEEMLYEYAYEGRGIIEQILNLSKEEKYQIFLLYKIICSQRMLFIVIITSMIIVLQEHNICFLII